MSVNVNTNAIFAMRDVGEDLQRLRTEAGLRQDDAASKLGVTRFVISKIERGKAFPTEEQLRKLFTLYNASTEQRATIGAKIDQGKSFGRAWWEQPRFRNLFRGDSYRFFYIEDAAERIANHSGTFIPGLLQTRAYIEAIVTDGQKHESAERRDVFVEARLKRQEVLSRRHPVALDALCLEAAIRAMVGGPEVMRQQLQHLLIWAARPNVTLRVIPYSAGAPSIYATPFSIVYFPGAENQSIVSQEKLTGEMLDDDPAEVRRVRRLFADRAESALSADDSIKMIEEIEKELR